MLLNHVIFVKNTVKGGIHLEELTIGSPVKAVYKTGVYVGEVTDIRPQHYLVRVLAVVKHPAQGDLHSPKTLDVGFFHERRALAYREQANIPLKMVKPYAEEIPDYKESLQAAVEKMKDELQADSSPWALKCLELMDNLEKDYFK
jgi:kinase-associated protein B